MLHATANTSVMVCACILAITALLKFFAVARETSVSELARMDPIITFMTTRQLLVWAAVLELEAATVLMMTRNHGTRACLLAFFVAGFGAYRIAYWMAGVGGGCPCLGNTSVLPWFTQGQLSLLSSVVAAVFFVLSFACIIPALLLGDDAKSPKTGVSFCESLGQTTL